MKKNLFAGILFLFCVTWVCVGPATAQESTNTPMDAFIARAKLQYSFKSVDNIWQKADPARFKPVDNYVSKAQLFTLDQGHYALLWTKRTKVSAWYCPMVITVLTRSTCRASTFMPTALKCGKMQAAC